MILGLINITTLIKLKVTFPITFLLDVDYFGYAKGFMLTENSLVIIFMTYNVYFTGILKTGV